MTLTDEFVALWKKMLADIDANLATANLKQHIMTNKFPPTIADIAKQPTKGFYDNHVQLAHQNALQLEEARKNAVPMPEYIRRELIGDE